MQGCHKSQELGYVFGIPYYVVIQLHLLSFLFSTLSRGFILAHQKNAINVIKKQWECQKTKTEMNCQPFG